MPVFRLRSIDGSNQLITAGRVEVTGNELRFQSPGSSGWTTVTTALLTEVDRVERRFNEADGRLRWADEHAVNDAALAARPEPVASGQDGTERDSAPPAVTAPAPRADKPAPPPAVSARDVRCPRCGEQEDLSGRRADGEILLTCHACDYDGPRVAQRRCPTCGSADVVERPSALVERARGTQLSVVGYTTVALCRTCDADDLAAALEHGGAVMPKELPTVDPQTLREMGRGTSTRTTPPAAT